MMDLENYISSKRQSFNEQSKTILDYSVFDFNYLPAKPFIREESKPIINAFIRYEKTGIPTNLVIFGSRGCGKTLTLKYLTKIMQKDSNLNILYANVRYNSTSFKILAFFLHMNPRGSSMSELYNKFRTKYSKPTIIILDEVHLWAPKEKQRELLYFLSRDNRNYMLIMLSNDPRFLSEIDQSVRSTLQPELIHFQNYNAIEITTILRERAKKGLSKPCDSINKQIAAITVSEANSDVRVGIKALFYWATHGRKDVTKCFENARKDIYVDLIADLSDTNLLILKAVTIVSDKFAKKVFAAYYDIAQRNNENPCSYVHFYNQLSYLQSLGLIMMLSTKVNRTYANRISLLCNPNIIQEVFKIRFM